MMKRIFTVLVLSILGQLVLAQGIEFFKGSFDEAKAEARAQGKLIFMDAYAVWCGPCKMMSNNVFPQKSVGDFFNANFINMKVDMEKGEGLTLRKQYGVSAYPTMMLIDGDGEVVQQIKGARGADALIDWAKKAALPNKSLTQKLQEKYDAGERDPGLMRDLIKVKSAYNEETEELMTEYLENLPAEEIVNPDNIDFILEQTKDIYALTLPMLNNYDDYIDDLKGEGTYEGKLIAIAQNSGKTAIKQKDMESLNETLDFLKEYKPADYKELSSELMVNYYGATEDWSNYDKAVTKHLAKYKKGDDKAYRDVAWNYYMKVEDEGALKKAEKWMQKNIKINNNYENNLTQAYLLYKLDQYSEAEDAVNYALILAGEEKKTKNAQILKDQILKMLNKTETAQ